MRHTLLYLISMFVSASALAQSERMAHWYFGHNAGIDFSSGQPVIDNNGQLRSWEASASISDLDGNLLFYTNGKVIWNKDHDTMLNGHASLGDESALKGSLIAPWPGHDDKYYVFSQSRWYHIVDMNGDNSLGEVTVRNHQFSPTQFTTESVAGTLHCNKRDYWIIGRSRSLIANDNDSMNFYVYLLDSTGLSLSTIQPFHFDERNIASWDHPTFSPTGKLFAYSAVGSDIYLFDFDRYTGLLTFKDTITFHHAVIPGDTTNELVYSTEFSPDETKLYATYWKKLMHYTYIAQYDLTATDIEASKVILDSIPDPPAIQYGWSPLGRAQLGPDGVIYVSRYRSVGQNFVRDTIDAILDPNQSGLLSNFQRDHLPLNGGKSTCGLPNFISNFSMAALGEPDCPEPSGINTTKISEIKIYPNPAEDVLWVNLGHDHRSYSITIQDVVGKKHLILNNLTSPTTNITTTDLPRGLYFVYVHNNGLLKKAEIVILK